MGNTLKIEVFSPARDHLELELEIQGDQIVRGSLRGVGCLSFLKTLQEWRAKLKGPLASLEVPHGSEHGAILLREAILKAQNKWNFPYADPELCHCRAVPTAKVDAAILAGCHTVTSLMQATSAGTSCGTCRPDLEKVLAYRKTGI